MEETNKIDYKSCMKINPDLFAHDGKHIAECAEILNGLVQARQWSNAADRDSEQRLVTALNSVAALIVDAIEACYTGEKRKFRVSYERPMKVDVVVDAIDERDAERKAEEARKMAPNPNIGRIVEVKEVDNV